MFVPYLHVTRAFAPVTVLQIANIWVSGTVTQTYLDNRYKGEIEIFCLRHDDIMPC